MYLRIYFLNLAKSTSKSFLSTISFLFKNLAIASLVISSSVGPKPPLVIIKSTFLLAKFSASIISSSKSLRTNLYFISIPSLFNSSAIYMLFVSELLHSKVQFLSIE